MGANNAPRTLAHYQNDLQPLLFVLSTQNQGVPDPYNALILDGLFVLVTCHISIQLKMAPQLKVKPSD